MFDQAQAKAEGGGRIVEKIDTPFDTFMFLKCGVENPYRLFCASTVRDDVIEKEIVTFYEVLNEQLDALNFKAVKTCNNITIRKVLNWVDVPSLRTVFIYAQTEPIVGIEAAEQGCEERHCTVITYQDEEQQALLGKSILPEPLTTHYNNAQFITI